MEQLAINGGKPVRETFLPYATQWIGEEEKKEVLDVLNSEWLTTGPKVKQFEEEFAKAVGAKYAIAVNSGTAALHCCMGAIGINPGDEVITTPFTFLATANAILYRGGTPILADIQRKTYNIDPEEIKKKITPKTKAILPVHYGGHPCSMDEIEAIAKEHHLMIIEDAAHAFTAEYKSHKIGSIGDLTIFSFHPVKNITTAEGGMITTNNPELAKLCVMYRTHGITKEAMERYGKNADWMYDMRYLGHRYNMTEFQAALGIAQLKKVEAFQARRRVIVQQYYQAFSSMPEIILPTEEDCVKSSWHLFTIRLKEEMLTTDRNGIIKALKAENIGVNVHYIPIHKHSYYQHHFRSILGNYPVTDEIYQSIVTLPLFPKMTSQDIDDVIRAVKKVIEHYRTQDVLSDNLVSIFPVKGGNAPQRTSSSNNESYFSNNISHLSNNNSRLANYLDFPHGVRSYRDGSLKLVGEKVRLVPFTNDHLYNPKYLSWLRDKEVMMLARNDYDPLMPFSKAEEYVQKQWGSSTDFFMAIEMNSVNHEVQHIDNSQSNDFPSVKNDLFIGTFRLANIDWKAHTVDLGVLIGEKSCWGKGIATEACQLAISFAFSQLGMNKVTMGCKETNTGIQHIATKLGFSREGYFRAQNIIDGQYVGHLYFGLLQSEYVQQKNSR